MKHYFVQGYRKTVAWGSQAETGHLQQTVKHPPKQMFQGCFTFIGSGSLIPIEGMINSEKCSDFLKCRVVQIMEENLPNGDGIFQHDLAPCHSSRKVKKVIEKLEINKSPDLNPVENIQGVTEGRLGKMDSSSNEWLTLSCRKTYICHTAPLTSTCCILYIIQQIYVQNILNMLHTLRFFLFKMPFIS